MPKSLLSIAEREQARRVAARLRAPLGIPKGDACYRRDARTVAGYVGRCITNGTATFEDILKQSCKGSTLDYREAELAAKMLIDGISENLKNGKIVDLGVIGKLYPAVNGRWDENPDNLQLSDMKPKVNYKAGDDIAAAVRGAQLQWTTEEETDENTVSDPDDQPTTPEEPGNDEPTEPTTPTDNTGDGIE